MILITSFLHRKMLSEIIGRWLAGRPHSEDARMIAELVNFNIVFVHRYLKAFADDLFDIPVIRVSAQRKGDLKDAIIENTPYSNARIEEMIRAYREHPEQFYRETPFVGNLIFSRENGADRYMGSLRIKRVRRLAEKSARRIIDFLFDRIRALAEAKALERPVEETWAEEKRPSIRREVDGRFGEAETQILRDLSQGKFFEPGLELKIDDEAGIKVIAEQCEVDGLLERLSAKPRVEILEKEDHSGNYNAVNLILRYRPDKDAAIDAPLGRPVLERFEARGIDTECANKAFRRFITEGEDTVHIEVIISSYQEMLESEIGRCMHEDRITEQRQTRLYRGATSKNVEYLMEYLFALAISPRADVGTLPIKLSNRYLPDYFDEVIKDLFQIPRHSELE
ncbi:hypothetical protein ACFL4G_11740 [Thermodesulfobacteriota bacterium]